MTRTDIHRPSVILPEDYEFVGFEYIKEGDEYYSDRVYLNAHMERTGGTMSRHAHGGSCHICGAHAIYTARFYHVPTNQYIRTGLDCAEKLDAAINSGVADDFRAKTRAAIEQIAGKRKAKAILEQMGFADAWDVYLATDLEDNASYTVRNMVQNLVKYGSFSPKQIAFFGSLMNRVRNKDAIAAQRAAEREAAKKVPITTGRVTIWGEVVSKKYNEDWNNYKIIVKHVDGWKVYGTLPRAIDSAKVGDTVKFDAVLTVSEKDEKFGFFSRPSKPELIAKE